MKAKILIFLFILSAFQYSCNRRSDSPGRFVNNPMSADGTSDESKMPSITFERTDFDFGRIYDGERVKCHFKFTNTGTSDLIITNAKGSCGCTVPEYPKNPIPPGQGGTITVEFNSSGRKGQQNKSITVSTNAKPPTVVLAVRAMVVEP